VSYADSSLVDGHAGGMSGWVLADKGEGLRMRRVAITQSANMHGRSSRGVE
jgi:hypothetical protein